MAWNNLVNLKQSSDHQSDTVEVWKAGVVNTIYQGPHLHEEWECLVDWQVTTQSCKARVGSSIFIQEGR